jgi:hypothetical protein
MILASMPTRAAQEGSRRGTVTTPPPEPVPAPPPIVNNRTIALDRFVRRSEIDARYLLSPYYVVPRDEVGGLPVLRPSAQALQN